MIRLWFTTGLTLVTLALAGAPAGVRAESAAAPAPPPAAVIAQYRRAGGNEVHGTFSASTKDHPELQQTEIDRPVYLMPDVPYTRWLLAEFKRRSEYHVKYPNTHMSNLEIDPDTKAIIRTLRTDESGYFQFARVPSGKYILFLDGQIDIPRDLDHLSEPTHPWAVWVRDAYHATYVSDPFEVGPAGTSFKFHAFYFELLRAAGVH